MARAQIRIKKGDNVYVLSGKEKGKTGKVLEIDHDKQRAVVEKLMTLKRHYKRGGTRPRRRAGTWRRTAATTSPTWPWSVRSPKKPTATETKRRETASRFGLPND